MIAIKVPQPAPSANQDRDDEDRDECVECGAVGFDFIEVGREWFCPDCDVERHRRDQPEDAWERRHGEWGG